MHRRAFLAATTAALAMPRLGNAQAAKPLRFVPEADLALLDPVVTTSYQTRDHGFMVFDTLYGQDNAYRIRPQMVEGHVVENDGLTWNLTLREGLKFHDGQRVLARDAVASIQRWGKRDAFGQSLMAAVDEISAPDDRTLQFRLKTPFPLLPDALGHYSPSMCPIMPARLAASRRLQPDHRNGRQRPVPLQGRRARRRARASSTRSSPATCRATSPPNAPPAARWCTSSASNGRSSPTSRQWRMRWSNGEIDWWAAPSADLLPMVKQVARRGDAGHGADRADRHHALQPDAAAVRQPRHPPRHRARRAAVRLHDRPCRARTARPGATASAISAPDTPMASDAGMENLTSPRNLDAVKKELAAAGYKGEKVALLGPMDIPARQGAGRSDRRPADQAPRHERRPAGDRTGQRWCSGAPRWTRWTRAAGASSRPPGAASTSSTPRCTSSCAATARPACSAGRRAPRIEELRAAWFKAPDLAAQQEVCEQLQLQAFQDVPYIPLGQALGPTAHRAELKGVLTGLPLFWNITRG